MVIVVYLYFIHEMQRVFPILILVIETFNLPIWKGPFFTRTFSGVVYFDDVTAVSFPFMGIVVFPHGTQAFSFISPQSALYYDVWSLHRFPSE